MALSPLAHLAPFDEHEQEYLDANPEDLPEDHLAETVRQSRAIDVANRRAETSEPDSSTSTAPDESKSGIALTDHPDLDEFLAVAQKMNPGVPRSKLATFWNETYGHVDPTTLPTLEKFLPAAQEVNPDVPDATLKKYWKDNYGILGAREKDGSNVVRGFKVGMGQLLPTAKGAVGLVGATAENALGSGGLSTAVKEWGLHGFQEGMQQLAPLEHENDQLTTVYDKVKRGDLGALSEFVAYGLGYGASQLAQSLAMGVAGGVAGSLVAGPAGTVPGAIGGIVEQTAAKGLIASWVQKAVAKRVAQGMTEAQAVKSIGFDIGALGSMGTFATGQEMGQIYPEAEVQAKKEGRTLTGSDLARVWGTSAVAGGSELIPEAFIFGNALGRFGKSLGATRFGRAGTSALTGGALEAGQEAFQTGVEHVGAGQPVADEAGWKDIVNSAGLAFIPGVLGGGTSGIMNRPTTAEPPPKPEPSPQPTIHPDTIPAAIGVSDPSVSVEDAITIASEILKTPVTPGSAVGPTFEPGAVEPNALNQLIERGGALPTQADLLEATRTKQPYEIPILPGPEPTEARTIEPGQAFTPRTELEPDYRTNLAEERARLVTMRETARANQPTGPSEETPVATQTAPEAKPSPLMTALEKAYPSVQDLHALAASKGLDIEKPVFREYTKMVTGLEHLDDLTPSQRQTLQDALGRVKTTSAALDTGKPALATSVNRTPTQLAVPGQADNPQIQDSRHTLPPEQNAEMLLRAEKAQADLEIAGKERGSKTLLETQGKGGTQDVMTQKSATADWYRTLTTGPSPMIKGDRTQSALQKIDEAIKKIIEDEGTDRGTAVEKVKAALLQDHEFRKTEWGRDLDAILKGEWPSWVPKPNGVDQAAHEAAPSPKNALPEPTPPQIEAGNYQKGHLNIAGMNISIEHPAGSTRSGTDANGKPWSIEMKSHYGYVRGTKGKDKEHIDVFVKPGTPENYSGPVFVVDQKKVSTGHFDEHKIILGAASIEEARQLYLANYTKNWEGIRSIKAFTMEGFKAWLEHGDHQQPAGIAGPQPKNETKPVPAETTLPITKPQSQSAKIAPMATERGPGSPENAQTPPEPGRFHWSNYVDLRDLPHRFNLTKQEYIDRFKNTASPEIYVQLQKKHPESKIFLSVSGKPKYYPMHSYQDASERVQLLVRSGLISVEDLPSVHLVDPFGKLLGHVSHDGRVWEGIHSAWNKNTNLLYDPMFPLSEHALPNPSSPQPGGPTTLAKQSPSSSDTFTLKSETLKPPKPKAQEQTSIPVPPETIGTRPIIGREAQPEEAPLFSKAAQVPNDVQTSLPEPGSVKQKEPWQMTRAEYRLATNQPKFDAIQQAIKDGKRIVMPTQNRAVLIAKPDHLRITKAGEIQIPQGREWVTLVESQIDSLASQTGMKTVPLNERTYHKSVVEQAIAEGQPVPPEVLADYPDLTGAKSEAAQKTVAKVGERTEEDILREINVGDKAKIDAYDPAAAVRKSGRHWTYDTVSGSSGQGMYDTKREATEAATRHKALKLDQWENPTGYDDLVRTMAREWLKTEKALPRFAGDTEMEMARKTNEAMARRYPEVDFTGIVTKMKERPTEDVPKAPTAILADALRTAADQIEGVTPKKEAALSGGEKLKTDVAFLEEARKRMPIAANNLTDLRQTQALIDVIDNLLKIQADSFPSVQASNLIEAKATSSEGLFQGMLTDTKALRDIIGSQAFLEQGFSGLDAKAQRLVLKHMLSLSHNGKVLDSVIQLIPVDVVNHLASNEFPAKVLLKNPSMLKRAITEHLNLDVPLRATVANTLVRAFALSGAVEHAGLALPDLIGPAKQSGPTGLAVNRNHGSDDTRGERVRQATLHSKETDHGTALFARALPTPEDADRIADLNRAMETQQSVPDAFVWSSTGDHALMQAFQEVFGAHLVPIKLKNPGAEGFLSMQYHGTLFVRTDTTAHGFVHLAGHELLHHIRKETPNLYAWFEAHAHNYLQTGAEVGYGRRLAAAGAGLHGLDAREEILADFTGDALADPAFLQVLADHNPTKFRLFVKSVLDWLRSVANKLTNKGFGSSQYFHDVNDLKGYLIGMLEKYSASHPMIDGPMFRRGLNEDGLSFDDLNNPHFKGVQTGTIEPAKARDHLGSATTAVRPYLLGALGLQQIADVYGRDHAEVARYNTASQQMEADFLEMSGQSDLLIKRWDKLKVDVADRMARVMEDARFAQFDADQTNNPLQPSTVDQKDVTARFNALPKDAQQLYRDVRDYYRDLSQHRFEAIKERIERSGGTAQNTKAAIDKLELAYEKTRGKVYFPFTRFGNHVVVAKKLQNGKEVDREVQTFDSPFQADQFANLMKARGWTIKRTTASRYSQQQDGSASEAVKEMHQIINTLTFADDLPGLTSLREQLNDALNQTFLNSLPDMSYAKHFLHAKDVKGFSKDALRAFAHSALHGAHHISRIQNADHLTRALSDLNKRIQQTEEGDVTEARQVYNEIVQRHEALLNPNTSPVAAWLGQLGFTMSLGGVVATGLTNATQVPLITLPWLGSRFGLVKSATALARAYKDFLDPKTLNADSLFDASQSERLPTSERAMLKELQRRGRIDLTQTMDLAGRASQDNLTRVAKQVGTLRGRMAQLMGFTFHAPEVMNRQVTAMATYRLAKEQGASDAAATDKAEQAIIDTHFIYSQENRARYMSGNVLRVLTMFKQYSQNIAFLYGRAAHVWLSKNGGTPEEKKIARKQLLTMAALQYAAAGALGMPVFGTIADLLTAMMNAFGDDDEKKDWEVELRKILADAVGKPAGEVLAHGVSRLTPWDMAARLGQNDLFFREPKKEREGRAAAMDWLTSLAGPVLSYAVNAYLGIGDVVKGLAQADAGHFLRGIEELVPAVLRNSVKALRYELEGGVRTRDTYKQLDVNAAEKLGQFFGFTPSRAAEMYESTTAIKNQEHRLTNRRNDLLDHFAAASQSKDGEARTKALTDIRAFNQRHPTMRISGDSLMRSQQGRLKHERGMEGGVYLDRKKAPLREEGSFANY